MRVYLPGKRNHSVFVTPACDPNAKELDGASQWKSADGMPIQYNVRFNDGVAEVDNLLGRWLIKHGYAQRTPLILPDLKRLVA